MLYSLRNYVELAYLALRREKTTDQFRYRFELSKYEFKNDLKKIKEMAKYCGMKIKVVNDNIFAEIIDNQLYQKKYKELFSFYYNNRYDFNDNDLIIQYYLIYRFLNDKCVIIDQVANDFGYSKSALRTPVKKARDFMSGFGIDTINRPYYGLCVEGNELDIRHCLLSIYNKLIIDIFTEYGKINQKEMINYSSNYKKFIIFCKENSLYFDSEENKRIVLYISVTEFRMKNNEIITKLTLEEEIYQTIIENNEIKRIALNIFDLFSLIENENEIVALMTVLLTSGVNRNLVEILIDKYYKNEKEELYEKILEMLNRRFKIVIEDKNILEKIDEIVSTIVIKYHCNELSKNKNRLTGRSANVYSYAICFFINESIKEVISKFYSLKINSTVVEKITDVIFYYIDSLKYEYKKSRIAISIRGSTFVEDLLRKKIINEVNPKYIECIDIVNNIDLLNNEEKYNEIYDLLITDTNLKNVSKTLTVSDMNNSSILLENWLRMNRDICAGICKGKFEVKFSDIKITNEKDVEECLRDYTELTEKEIKHGLRNCYLWKDIVFIMLRSIDENVIFYLGQFSKPVDIKGRKMGRFIILKGNINEDNIKVLNVLVHELSYDMKLFNQLKKQPEKQVVNNHLNSIMR